MATVFEVDGTRRVVHPATLPSFTLEEMQALVGGYIDTNLQLRVTSGRLP